jgi:Protein of unknown function (DUF3105)
LAKDPTPGNRGTGGSARGGSTAAGKGGPAARGGGGKGRTRPPTQVVTQPRRPWGLIAAAVAVVLFAVAAIGYAVVKVQDATADEIESPEELGDALQTYEYAAGQTHVTEPVVYAESPPVGGPHEPPPDWADCTGTVYDVDIRHENAVHSLEHGAVWITYNPDEVSDADIDTLSSLASASGRMLSPYEGLDSPVSIQSWNHQLKVDAANDERLAKFADFFTYNADYYPEPGASCENPTFIENPRLESDDQQEPDGSVPSTSPEASAPASGSAEPSGSSAPSEPADPSASSEATPSEEPQ